MMHILSEYTQIKIITSDWCTFCEAAKKLLKTNGIDYVEVDLQDNLDIMIEHNLRLVPQIFVDGKLLKGGYTGLKKSIDTFIKEKTNG